MQSRHSPAVTRALRRSHLLIAFGPALAADPAGPYRADNHMWLHAASGGKVLQFGPSKQMNRVSTSGAGSIAGAGPRADTPDAMTGNGVAYDIGKLLPLGGSPAYAKTSATPRAYTVGVSDGQVQSARTVHRSPGR
ncbi:hypothetical protein [Streptomyces sp. NPDC058701]|uniref:hypothetical protein n=1 Tax=Streptomyces sp. NPDC058701 TaxID=3346608 RepID=UPI003660A3EA